MALPDNISQRVLMQNRADQQSSVADPPPPCAVPLVACRSRPSVILKSQHTHYLEIVECRRRHKLPFEILDI